MKNISLILIIVFFQGLVLNQAIAFGHISDLEPHLKSHKIKQNQSSFDTLPVHNNDDKIIGMAKAYEDSIVLRMSPPYYLFWESVKQNGFTIKRGTSKDNLKEISKVFPYPMESSESKLREMDSISQVAYFLLYGNIDRGDLQGYKLYQADQNILGMAMLVSEFSKDAANILGFRYVDRNVSKGQKYVYEISTEGFKDSKHNEVIELVNTLQAIKEPVAFQVLDGDNTLTLQWSKDNVENFTYYKIERSTDQKNFEPITLRPLFFNSTNDTLTNNFTYKDSLDIINGTTYYYRLYGGNSFAEYSLAANASGTPRDLTPPVPPKITKVTFDDKLIQFELEWDIEIATVPADFAYYQVMASRDERVSYSAVSPKLGLADFNYTYDLGTEWKESNEGRYYFRLECYDKNGNKSSSEFETSFVPDYTDPAAPDTLSGYVDSLSFVHLKWDKSTSKDVRGYWLYWGNSTQEELALVSQSILTDTSYQYYIPEKSLQKNMYYVVRAEDHAYNRSDVSNIAKVKLLDKVPPIRPSIKSIQNDSLRLQLNLGLSPSDDVYFHELYRRETMSKDTSWQLLDTLWNIDSDTYIDQIAELNKSYQYKIRAVDSVANKSTFSPVKSGVVKVTAKSTVISQVSVKQKEKSKAVEVSWQVEVPKKLSTTAFTVEIYRSSGQDGIKHYKKMDKDLDVFTDTDLQSGVLYNYAVRVHYDNGWTSELSEIKSILIK